MAWTGPSASGFQRSSVRWSTSSAARCRRVWVPGGGGGGEGAGPVVAVEVIVLGGGLGRALPGGAIVVKSPPRNTVRPTTANARTLGARPSGVGHTPQVWSASAVGPEPASTGGGTDTARATGRSRGTASASATTSRRNRTRRRRQTRVDIEKQVRHPKCPFLHGLPTLSANGVPAAPPLLLAFRR